jgi:ribosome-binding protein aMBF1 (putative translation factor)
MKKPAQNKQATSRPATEKPPAENPAVEQPEVEQPEVERLRAVDLYNLHSKHGKSIKELADRTGQSQHRVSARIKAHEQILFAAARADYGLS